MIAGAQFAEAAPAMLLCLDCEDMTGARAIRQVTADRHCRTCGSASVLPAPRHVWRWQEETFFTMIPEVTQ